MDETAAKCDHNGRGSRVLIAARVSGGIVIEEDPPIVVLAVADNDLTAVTSIAGVKERRARRENIIFQTLSHCIGWPWQAPSLGGLLLLRSLQPPWSTNDAEGDVIKENVCPLHVNRSITLLSPFKNE